MNSKHTEGKWRQAYRNEKAVLCTTPDIQIVTICSAATEEDAQLIAAAPDLLEALNGLMYGHKMNIQFETPDEQHKYNAALRAAKDAIEKATS